MSAGYQPDSINMLVNVGVYRERGLGEPALAALIQQDVDANAGRIKRGEHGTFSFDVDNGACGALTGLDVVRGFLTSHAIHVGMVVGSDSAPGPLHVRALPRPESGAAILLGRDEGVVGLSAVRQRTYPEYAELLEGYWEWVDGAGRFPRRPGNRLVVLERRGFVDRAAQCAAEVTTDYLDDFGVPTESVDLLVATPGQTFADELADLLGIGRERTLHVGEQLGAMHTAQPIAAIDQARRTGRWAAARTILLVAAGSGITVTTALYRH
ncbi:MAG TPA: 3-oxoacyl-[acyl-carrier-protein] synthase III C-terminal domain-containing protein [Mycobacteriales bacterium]|nr:3-oxoacyl-[acyl-carrier-protein] synthase III C-terminal domain-containing protein [Mycobacteriales bacterium]